VLDILRTSLRRRGRDQLTGLATYRDLGRTLEREQSRLAREPSRRSGLLLLDLDGLKLVNDRHGHEVGDRVIVEVARRLERVLREADFVARMGGDEFAVVAPSVHDEESLDALSRALRVAVGAEPVRAGAKTIPITITVGAVLLEGGKDVYAALRLADQRMYVAKSLPRTDAFDRLSDLVVGLLVADDDGLEAAFASGVAEVAAALTALVEADGRESWWPHAPAAPTSAALRKLASEAKHSSDLAEQDEAGLFRLAAPLMAADDVLGALAAERAVPFGKADRIALARTGRALGYAVIRLREGADKRRRLAELEQLAYEDENTGLPNRRGLLDNLARHEGAGQLAVLFVDFDGLRDVNNRLSYEHGNELLRIVAEALKETLADGESAARLHGSGGDEFIVVCPGLDEPAAERRAQALEAALAQPPLPDDIAALYGGASVGHAVRGPGETALDLLERAAALMRARKRARKSARPRS
jgi:diguanylate cyclase (GGDEF)-like protein